MTESRKESGLVQKTVHVLRTIAAHAQGIGLSELARETGISKPTCYRIIRSLEDEGWLTADASSRHVRLANDLVLTIGAHRAGLDIGMLVDDVLRDVAKELSETAGLDRLDPPGVVVLREVQGPHHIGHAPKDVPRRLSATRTSTGRVLIASAPDDVAHAHLAAETDPGLDVAGLERERAALADRGYTATRNQLENGLAAYAVPVPIDGAVRYALWISGPTYRVDELDARHVVATLTAAAERLGRILQNQTVFD
ncbi:IclR family transcriptional regulator [Microbacterium halotolerans]|uniref:IclR family transcriptional regulator n=1 Tax=Microbacterium halotolerans TaxID=246613 RepID=UPI000E6AC14F|nr:helix-turn-helix domain-containing protein [Microbacterium halotolerans]